MHTSVRVFFHGLALALACVFAFSACRSGSGSRSASSDGAASAHAAASADTSSATTLYSRVGMHAESKRGVWKMYSTNYLGLPKSFPPGTKFTQLSRDSDELELRLDDGSTLSIEFVQKHNRMSFDEWIARQFSDQPVALPSGLSSVEQSAIASGRYEVGLSRQALFLAIGYPPASLTPSFDGSPLLYQVKRFNKVAIHMGADGRVSSIQN